MTGWTRTGRRAGALVVVVVAVLLAAAAWSRTGWEADDWARWAAVGLGVWVLGAAVLDLVRRSRPAPAVRREPVEHPAGR